MRRARILPFWLLMTLATLRAAGLPAQESGSWTARLRSPDANQRAKAAKELGKSGNPSAIPALTAAVSDSSSKVRREVVIALSLLRGQESLDGLIAATRDVDKAVRVLAIKGLVGNYTSQSAAVSFAGFWDRTWRTREGRFVEESIRIDPGLRVDTRVISALVAALNDANAVEASREAADALGILVPWAAVPDLVQASYSPDKSLALVALNALAKIKDPSAGPQLANLLGSPNEEIRLEAAVTVGILKSTEALPRLQAMFENGPDMQTRKKAMEGLAYLGDPASVPLFTRALGNADVEIRAFAAEGLARAGERKVLAELIRAAQGEEDGGAKLAVQFAVAALGREDFLSALVNDLGSTRLGIYAQAYLIELSKNKKLLPSLYLYLNSRDAGVCSRLSTVLMFTGDRTSVEPLEHLSRDSDGDVAQAASRALRAIHSRIITSPDTAGTEENMGLQTAAADVDPVDSAQPPPATEDADYGVGARENMSLQATAAGSGRRESARLHPPSEGADYVIGPVDELDVSVWKEPELSRTVTVRPDGKISLPLLNDVQAAGLTPTQLAAAITEMLRKYVTLPRVTVIVTAMNSQRVFVLGEVNRPGAIPLLPNMTVIQAIASAGSFTQFANQKRIYVLRNEDGKQNRYPFNYKTAVRGDTSQNISLKPGDTIVVP